MKLIYLYMFFIFALTILFIINIFNGNHDSVPEEVLEDMIEHFTGVDVDLTWDSPETGHLP